MKYLLTGQETERLRFRLLNRDDFNNWMELFSRSNAGEFLGMADIPNPEAQCERWFNLSENRYKNDLGGMNVLVDKTTNQMVGQCGLLIQQVDEVEELEVGYSILPQYQNRGYATEAAIKCRDFAFLNNFCDSLISIIHVNNVNSEKVALKNGMKKSKQSIYKGMPVNIFRIYKSEWMNIRTSGVT